MEKVTGRSDDMIILRGVNVFPTQIEEQLMNIRALAPHFQIELSRPDRMDQMRIRTEVAGTDISAQTRTDAAKQLAAAIKDSVGISASVDVGDVGAIPRSQGKAVRIIDTRPKT